MTNELSNERYQEAMELHAQIMASGSTAAKALVEFARLLKLMKDERLYAAFDQTFDEYVENQVGIKKRQAYTYIAAFERLGAPMMEANAGLGITKLELLSQVSPLERDEVVENYDLEGMSAADVKKLVSELNDKGEQLTFAIEENERLKGELEEVKTEAESTYTVEELQAELDKVKEAADKRLADAVSRAKAEATAANARAVKEAVSKALSDAAAKQSQDTQKAIENAKKQAAEEAAEKAKIQYEHADRKNEELRQEIEALKKKMSIAGNQDAAIVSAYCKTVLAKVLSELVEMIEGAKGRDAEQGAKLACAAAGLLGSAQAQIAALAEVK